jgi:tetratricopeptide (TPR) repeat protein
MSHLAVALSSQGKYIEAEQTHQQTLELRQKVLGLEHPDTLTSMSHLGAVLSMQGKYVEAEQMHRQTLELGQKVPGLPCRYCKDPPPPIGPIRERDYEHQPSLKALKQSMDDGCRLCRFLWGSFHAWNYDSNRAILDSEENAHLWIGRYKDQVLGAAADSIEAYYGQEYPGENVRKWLELVTEDGLYYAQIFQGMILSLADCCAQQTGMYMHSLEATVLFYLPRSSE